MFSVRCVDARGLRCIWFFVFSFIVSFSPPSSLSILLFFFRSQIFLLVFFFVFCSLSFVRCRCIDLSAYAPHPSLSDSVPLPIVHQFLCAHWEHLCTTVYCIYARRSCVCVCVYYNTPQENQRTTISHCSASHYTHFYHMYSHKDCISSKHTHTPEVEPYQALSL